MLEGSRADERQCLAAGAAIYCARPVCAPAVKLCGNQLRKGQATYRLTAVLNGANKYWKLILLHHFYFTGIRGNVVGAATTVVEGSPMQTGTHYITNALLM